jgi:hypothetical protein
MRIALMIALLALSGCAGERLAAVPPPGVDFTGRWKLNEADSDDPLHLAQAQNAALSAAQASPTGQGGQGGQGGRGGGRGSRGGGTGGFGGVGPGAGSPPMPGMSDVSEGLRWPAKDVEIKQLAGVVAITSAGTTQVCRPPVEGKAHHRRKAADDDRATPGRDMPARDRREAPAPSCGWDEKTLVVQSRDSDEEAPPFAKRYSLSEDGQRLIELVGFKGGRSGGFSMSRVWDRVPTEGAAPSGSADTRR